MWLRLRAEDELTPLFLFLRGFLPCQRPPEDFHSGRLPVILPDLNDHQQVQQDHCDGLMLSRFAPWEWDAARFSWSLPEKGNQDNNESSASKDTGEWMQA